MKRTALNRAGIPVFLALLLTFSSVASGEEHPLATLAESAAAKSEITAPGSRPFHLRAVVYEATNRDNDSYNAEIEEYWMAPNKWRRTVKTEEFTQTLVVNGENKSEQITGEYFPNWLRTVVAAIFDPAGAVAGVDMSKSADNPVFGGTKLCRRFEYRVGIPPASNRVFSVYCFDHGLMDSVQKPGYRASYNVYRKFTGKEVARKIREYIEPGTELEASIDELSEWTTPDESLFFIEQPNSPLQTLVISEEDLRGLAQNQTIHWPPIRGGKSSGVLSIYVALDRSGRVRETYALNSDHPAMSDAAREQVAKWHFKPAVSKGVPVQVESILTFAYQTKVEATAGTTRP